MAQEMTNRQAELEQAEFALQNELDKRRTEEQQLRTQMQDEGSALHKTRELVQRLARERESEWIMERREDSQRKKVNDWFSC